MPPISSFNRVEINLGAIKPNCQAVKRLISDKMMAVIKGDAYGHGLVECGWALASIKVGRIGVLDLDEALALQKAGVPGRFYVLAGLQGTAQSAKAVEAGVTVLAYRWEQLADLDKAAKKADRPVRVMLKMDTGMGRLGFSWREGPEVIAKAAKLEGAVVEGLATHLATSGDQEARTQLKRFNELKAVADKIFTEQVTHSALASGGVLAHPDYRDDMSRVGLMLYGYSPLPESHRALFDLSTSRA